MFASPIFETSFSVMGAVLGGSTPFTAWSFCLAAAGLIVITVFFIWQIFKLINFCRRHIDACWVPNDELGGDQTHTQTMREQRLVLSISIEHSGFHTRIPAC